MVVRADNVLNVFRQTRVVHFIGAMKPWHYEYDTTTCRLKETGTISPHLLQMWWDIFLAFVNPRLSRHMPGLVGQLALLQVRRPVLTKFVFESAFLLLVYL